MFLCATATLTPTRTVRPTECYADPDYTPTPGAPTPEVCTTGEPTPTPWPTPTPYWRKDYFMLGQDVYAGPLRLQIKNYERGTPPFRPSPRLPGDIYHYFTVEVEYTGQNTLTVWLPMQMAIKEIRADDGSILRGSWFTSEPAMNNVRRSYTESVYFDALNSGETRELLLGFEAPAGDARVISVALDTSQIGEDPTFHGGNIVDWLLVEDENCPWGNVEDPPFFWEGTPVPAPPANCPLPVQRPYVINRGWGCTLFWTGHVAAPGVCPNDGRTWFFHTGIDFDVKIGDPIYAVAGGTISAATQGKSPYCDWGTDPKYGFGNYVQLSALGAEIFHGHLSKFHVSPGQSVGRGFVIGDGGTTGCSTGPHLHWEVRVGGYAVDPFGWLVTTVCPPASP